MTSKPDYPDVPETLDDLPAAIRALIDGVSDPAVAYGPNTDGYGKCVEAMWRAAYMAHELVASALGVTGFQHGMSSLYLVGALQRIEGPYRIVNATNALYPQYDLLADTKEFLESEGVRSWLAEQARGRLAEGSPMAAGPVTEHWRRLAAYQPTTKES